MLYNMVARVYTASMAEKEKRRSRVRAGGEAVRRRLRERPRIRPTVYGYLTEEKESLRQGFAALFLSSMGELVAGIALASIAGILDELAGLAVLIPAAIGMRGGHLRGDGQPALYRYTDRPLQPQL